MYIPFYQKENRNDCGCAPVCLKMALAYFEIVEDINDIYKICESIGDVHYTLPWGICIGAAKKELHSIFVSKNPIKLLPSSYNDISRITRINVTEISKIVLSQIKRCEQNDFITMLEWRQEFRELPKKFIQESIEAVMIPTVWWGTQCHNIVMVNYMDPGIELSSFNGPNGFESVYYHDPNGSDTSTMPESEFFKKWLNPYTDNDLLIISKQKLNLNSQVFCT